jgi:hypothetical protein
MASFKNLICYSYTPEENADHENLNIGQCGLLDNFLRDLNNVKSENWNDDSGEYYLHPIDDLIMGKNMWDVTNIYHPEHVNHIFKCIKCKYSFSLKNTFTITEKNVLKKPYKWRWNDAGYAFNKLEAEIFDRKIQHFDECHNTLPENWNENWEDSLEKDGRIIGEKYIKCKDCNWQMKFYYSMNHGLYFDTITSQLVNIKQVHRRICNGEKILENKTI